MKLSPRAVSRSRSRRLSPLVSNPAGSPCASSTRCAARIGAVRPPASGSTLVGRDHNGQFVKFYDARTGGGFDESPPLGPCEAADECHGVDSSPPAPATIASGANVPSGNVTNPPTKKKKQHKKAKRHHRRHHKRHHHG